MGIKDDKKTDCEYKVSREHVLLKPTGDVFMIRRESWALIRGLQDSISQNSHPMMAPLSLISRWLIIVMSTLNNKINKVRSFSLGRLKTTVLLEHNGLLRS